MKLIVFLMSFLTSTVFACQDLTGSYLCKTDFANIDLKITKISVAPLTYKLNMSSDQSESEQSEDLMIVDGKERTTTEIEGGITYNFSQTYRCINNMYEVIYKEIASDNSFSMTGIDKLTLNSAQDIEVKSAQTITEMGETATIEYEYTCISQ